MFHKTTGWNITQRATVSIVWIIASWRNFSSCTRSFLKNVHLSWSASWRKFLFFNLSISFAYHEIRKPHHGDFALHSHRIYSVFLVPFCGHWCVWGKWHDFDCLMALREPFLWRQSFVWFFHCQQNVLIIILLGFFLNFSGIWRKAFNVFLWTNFETKKKEKQFKESHQI